MTQAEAVAAGYRESKEKQPTAAGSRRRSMVIIALVDSLQDIFPGFAGRMSGATPPQCRRQKGKDTMTCFVYSTGLIQQIQRL
jgi:hypothetical protein